MFNEKYSVGLEMFSVPHIIALIVGFGILACIVIFRKKFLCVKADRIFRYTLGSVLAVCEITFHIWTAVMGNYSLDMIPLFGLCAISNVLTIIALFTNSDKIISVCLYWGLCGAFFALLFIDTTYMPPHFRFFHYFLIHFGFVYGGVYFVVTGKMRPTRKGVNLSCIILFSYSMILLALDLILEENWLYMVTAAIPAVSEAIPAPWYTILWVIAIFCLINVWYFMFKLIFFLNDKWKQKKSAVLSAESTGEEFASERSQ